MADRYVRILEAVSERKETAIGDIPHRISAPIVLFRTEDAFESEDRSRVQVAPDWGWGRFTKSEVFTERVSGNHVNMMNAPHVEVLAEKLKRYLKSCDSHPVSRKETIDVMHSR